MKDIDGYEGLYAITSCGKVWSYRTKKFLKPQKMKNGYLRIGLYKDDKPKFFYVHRLVALAYVSNPDNLETVDHIDENKEHNYINNLRWLSRKENKSRSQSKLVRCVETGQVFNSMKIAEKELGLRQNSISTIYTGKQKTTGGYHFEFI